MDGDESYASTGSPAGLAPASLGVVHDVIGHEEPCLHPLDGPAQHGEARHLPRSQLHAFVLKGEGRSRPVMVQERGGKERVAAVRKKRGRLASQWSLAWNFKEASHRLPSSSFPLLSHR